MIKIYKTLKEFDDGPLSKYIWVGHKNTYNEIRVKKKVTWYFTEDRKGNVAP